MAAIYFKGQTSRARHHPSGGSPGGGIDLYALKFMIGGVIGDFFLIWRRVVAVWYVPMTDMPADCYC